MRLVCKTFVSGAAIGIAALLLAACSSGPPPRSEIAVAKSVINDAIVSGAAEGAPAELRSAQEKLDRANAAMTGKDYKRARRLAEEAEADARLALVKEQSVKSQKTAQDLRESVRAVMEEIDRQSR